MINCRLKIIASNIINDIDTPEIKYISKNENMKISYDNNEEINQNEINESDEINYYNIKNLETNNKNNINKLDNLQQIDELINIELENYNKIENFNSKINDNKNIDSNELYTISNQHIYDDNYYSANISNYNTISNFYKQESKSNSFHMNDSKRNESNLSLKYIFRKREHKNYRNRSFSNKFSDDKKEKKYNLIKDIFKTHPVNYTNMKILSKNKEKNKVGNILNININKSFCINNNIKINHKNITQKNLSKNKSQKKGSGKNSKTKKQIKLEQIKEYKNVMKKVKPLKFSKRTNKNKSLNDITNASVAWYYVENNDMNNEQGKNYKILIDELRVKEMDLIQEKEKIIQTYEEKLKPLRELNSKLINENSEELNKEDELRGELVILKNQYERLIKTNKNKNSKKDNNIIMNNNKGLDDNNKEKIIEQEINYLNEKLNKGEILLITKPAYEIKISEQEDKNMVLMLKGLFYSIHIRDTDRIVDLVWKSDKQIQTIYFLVNEIMKLFNLKNSEKNLLINFFYSFCKKYKYIDINEFKKEFKEKIGDIPLYNNKIYISKLLNFNGTKMIELIKLMKEKDTFNLGFLTLDQVNALLNNLCLSFDSEKDFNDIYEFIMITMKKDRSFNLFDDNDTNNINEQENKIKFSLFDLFYQSLIDLIEEFDYNIIYNPFDSIRNYMQKNEINNAELLLKPLLNNKYIIKINNKEYFDIEILNKYLRKLGIIQLNEAIYINCYEEELVDKNKFIDDINDYGINETKETDLNKLNQNVNDLINGIFDNYQ